MGVPFRSAAASGNYGGSPEGSITVNAPAGVVDGDLLIGFLLYGGYGLTVTPPSGWTALGSGPTQIGTNFTVAAYERTATSNEPATYTWGLSGNAYVSVVVADYEQAAIDSFGAWTQSAAAPDVTTTESDETVVGLWGAYGTSSSITVPSGSSGGGSELTGTGTAYYPSALQTYSGPSTPGSFSPGTATMSGSQAWAAASLALKPGYAAPSAPTLTAPANASYQDATQQIAFTGTYNSTDGQSQNAYAFHLKTSGGSYNYWNASTSALQSAIVWNADSVAVGGSWTVTLPAGTLSDGNTYNWSFASQEAGANLQGPFASDFTFTAQAPPTVNVIEPSGTVAGTTQPVVGWTPTLPSGAAQIAYQVIVESGSFSTTPGSGTQDWTSGVVSSSATSVQVGTALSPQVQYRVFVQVTETGGQTSNWAYSTFTLLTDVPATPLVTAAALNDPTTGAPKVQLVIQCEDNWLSSNDASFEAGVGTAVGTNCAVAQSSAEALDGSYSLSLTASTAGNMSATLGPYACETGQEVNAFAAFRAATTARTCTVGIAWQGAAGSATSAGAADATGAWTQATPTTAPPAGLVVTATAPAGATGFSIQCTVEAAASSEVHYLDCVAAKPASSAADATTWSAGGFVGSTTLQVTRPDESYVRGASQANPATVPTTTQQVILDDYEVVQGESYTYSAEVVYAAGTQSTLSSSPGTSGSVTALSFQGWWFFDPTDPSGAVGGAEQGGAPNPVKVTDWSPVNTEASAAHIVMGVKVMTMVADQMLNFDFTGNLETFQAAAYSGLLALLKSQKTLYISSPFGATDTGYFRAGPNTGGLSTGSGNQSHKTSLQPSTAENAHRKVQLQAIAQARPSV